MKKSKFLLIPFVISLLAGCDKIKSILPFSDTSTGIESDADLVFDEGKDLTEASHRGALGEFSLLAPANNAIVTATPTFSWTESENALCYTLEVCSNDAFYSGGNSNIYLKETNIDSTSYKITGNLKFKNITYYWRVTAVNSFNSKSVGKEKVSETSTFFYKTESVGEIDFGVGESEDWVLHKVGSVADVSINHNDFFGTGEADSLVISFEKEKTSQGIPSSDGWIVVQKAVEKDFYGTDAFYCNFYYMGHDSTILIRIIDQDGELWYKQVKFTMDVRQMALLRFDEFILRTGDTVVQNREFNYEHIQAIEVCFERTFGDGCCIVGGLKAVNYDDYSYLFVDKLDFNLIPQEKWTYESYDFYRNISEDGSELTLEYSTSAGFNGNEKGIGSYTYGFAKLPLERYFADGNAIRMKVKHTGSTSKQNAIVRIYEPDKDRWSYSQPFTTLSDEYSEIVIPFIAFEQSNIIEGKRQFYYISNLQFGLNNCYSSGSISFKDFEIITVDDVSLHPKHVGNDAIIDDFDEYVYRGQAYEHWTHGTTNKDEAIFISQDDRLISSGNVNTGKFTYKADMEMAKYEIYTEVEAEGLNALKFWIKDDSKPLTSNPVFSKYTPDDVRPKAVFEITLVDERLYRYEIDKLPGKWNEYIIPLDSFELVSGYIVEESVPFESQNVAKFSFGLQYFYMSNGLPVPTYAQNNPVYMDEIMFVSASEISIKTIEKELTPDENGRTLIDNFEYESNESLHDSWVGLNGLEYEEFELSDEVSSSGENHSMRLNYKANSDSPSYATYPKFASNVLSKAITFDLKGDDFATIYLNFYLRIGGNLYQYRYTVANASSTWTRYQIGFSFTNFVAITTNAPAFDKALMQNLQRMTFGVTGNPNEETSSVYVDNISLLWNDATYEDKIINPLG